MIKFGVLGVGNRWHSTCQPALERLRQRVQIRALFDPVSARGIMTGRQMQALMCDSLTSLLTLNDIDAILVLNSSWYGESLLQFLLHYEKPCFLANNIAAKRKSLRKIHDLAIARGQTMMPALRLRYTPSTGRLQELMETTLGPPNRIDIEIPSPDNECPSLEKVLNPHEEMLICLFDWCQYILKAVPLLVSPLEMEEEAEQAYQISYSPCRRKNADAQSTAPQVNLVFVEPKPVYPECPKITVTCSHGKATLWDETRVEWQNGSDAENESLVADRSAFEVMLDHFCRRVVGGLIPVADLADYERSLRLHQALNLSCERKSPVSLLGKT